MDKSNKPDSYASLPSDATPKSCTKKIVQLQSKLSFDGYPKIMPQSIFDNYVVVRPIEIDLIWPSSESNY